jgi:hypothetical protein
MSSNHELMQRKASFALEGTQASWRVPRSPSAVVNGGFREADLPLRHRGPLSETTATTAFDRRLLSVVLCDSRKPSPRRPTSCRWVDC